MPEPEYERRVFAKGDAEQICATVQQEVALRWSGWRAVDDPVPTPPAVSDDADAKSAPATPAGAEPATESAPKRARSKPE